MLSVPVGLQIRTDLGVDEKNARRPFINPAAYRLKIDQAPYRRRSGTVPSRNGGKIGFRKLHDIDRIALSTEEMNFRSVRAVVVDKDAQSQAKADRSFEICDGHHEAAITGSQHSELARICDGKANRRCQTKPD